MCLLWMCVLGELLREEQRLTTQLGLIQETVSTEMVNVAYMAQGKGRYKMNVQCFSCKEFGYIAKHCSKKFCNYCKKKGHIIKDCRVRYQNGQGQGSYHIVQSNLAAVSSTPASKAQSSVSSSSTPIPEIVQQIIISAFSALGLQGSSVGGK